MQKREAPAAALCLRLDLGQRQQRLGGDPGVVPGGLRAVAAVLGATAGLDVRQGAELHPVGIVTRRVNGLGAPGEGKEG